jgi:heme/copper-type cytochrome/quinol oxidase subunit 2
MSRKVALVVALAVAVVPTGAALTVASGGEAKGAVKVRQIYMSAVEWKGSASVAKEAFPTAALPSGGGYEKFAPGTDEVEGDQTKWAIETYRFDTGVVAACVGERVVLNIFGVNSAHHDINIPDFGKSFRVKRGMLSRSTFTVKKPGVYPIICITHMPSHRADLVVMACG